MVSKLSDMQWHEVEELGRAGMRGKAIKDELDLDLHPANINKHLQLKGIGATGEVAELTLAEARRAQLEQLFAKPLDSPPIKIEKLKDGARVVIASDFQLPFSQPGLVGGVDNKVGAFEAFLADYDPALVILNGDIRDCYSLSSFDRDPSRRFGEKEEKRLTQNELRAINKAAPRARKIFHSGNHEARLERTYAQLCQKDSRAFEIFSALGFETLNTRSMLNLDDLGYEYQPYSGWTDVLGLIVTHGDLIGHESGETARKIYEKWKSSAVVGHSHRLAAFFHTDAQGKAHAVYEGGCMCRLDGLGYTVNPNWQNGWIIGEVHGGLLHTQLVPVFDDRFWVPGVGSYKLGTK